MGWTTTPTTFMYKLKKINKNTLPSSMLWSVMIWYEKDYSCLLLLLQKDDEEEEDKEKDQ